MDSIKHILNNLKCPICKGQIDLFNNRYSQYCCVNDYDHYMITFKVFPTTTIELVHVYDEKHKYALQKINNNGKISTKIAIFNIDSERRVSFCFKQRVLNFDYELFDFTNFDIKKVLNRIKTIFVFK